MALPYTRQALIDWCLRKLGAPVIEINVDEDQVEQRIDEGLSYFRDYHFDGVERCYLKHQITASSLTLAGPAVGVYEKNQIIKGDTSGAEAWVYDISDDLLTIRFKTKDGLFQLGEDITNQDSGGTATISTAANSIEIGDLDNQYIPVIDRVISITDLVTEASPTAGASLGGIFDFQYQWALNNMFNLTSTDLVTYNIYKQYIDLWEFIFKGLKGIRFNRKTDRVYIDVFDYQVDQYVILEAWVALDPEQYKEVYSDEIVREYCYNLIKLQWGNNLKKFEGIQLQGGTTLNGQKIYDEAYEDLEKLRERVRNEFELPPDMLVG